MEVSLESLDSDLGQLRIKPADVGVLKVDVEGAELEACAARYATRRRTSSHLARSGTKNGSSGWVTSWVMSLKSLHGSTTSQSSRLQGDCRQPTLTPTSSSIKCEKS